MKDNFNWNRFSEVFIMDARSLWSRYGLTMLILSVIPLAVWLFCAMLGQYAPDDVSPLTRWFIIGVVTALACIMTPSQMYKSCNQPKEGIYYAMLPASCLEKYLSMLLFSVIICPLLVLCGSILTDCIARLMPIGHYNQWLFADNPFVYPSWYVDDNYSTFLQVKDIVSPLFIVIYTLLVYLMPIALFLFTNTLFRRHKVLKTILWCWLIQFVLQLISLPILLSRIANLSNSESIMEFYIFNTKLYSVEGFRILFWTTFAIIFINDAVLLWGTYRRLKKMKY